MFVRDNNFTPQDVTALGSYANAGVNGSGQYVIDAGGENQQGLVFNDGGFHGFGTHTIGFNYDTDYRGVFPLGLIFVLPNGSYYIIGHWENYLYHNLYSSKDNYAAGALLTDVVFKNFVGAEKWFRVGANKITVTVEETNNFWQKKIVGLANESLAFEILLGSETYPFESYVFGMDLYAAKVTYNKYSYDGAAAALPDVSGIIGKSIYLDLYSNNESGSINGIVTEGLSGQPKLPLITNVALHERMTHRLIAITRSNADGSYTFTGVDSNLEYYATALHPTRKYNAVIQDGLRSGMPL